MDKEIVRHAVETLNEAILMQKEAMLLLRANGIEVTDVSVLFNSVQIYAGIERLAEVLGYKLTETGTRNDPTFYHDGVKFFELGKENIDDLSAE